MANIVRRNENERGISAPTSAWDPIRRMREMLSWDPFSTFEGLSAATEWTPRFEVRETSDAWVFKADLPGVEEKDLDVTVNGNQLTIQGKREAESQQQGETYYTYERSFGSFARSFHLPEGVDVDHINAELRNGVLTLHVPKRDEVKPRKISVALKGMVDKVKGSLGSGDKAKA